MGVTTHTKAGRVPNIRRVYCLFHTKYKRRRQEHILGFLCINRQTWENNARSSVGVVLTILGRLYTQKDREEDFCSKKIMIGTNVSRKSVKRIKARKKYDSYEGISIYYTYYIRRRHFKPTPQYIKIWMRERY